MLIKEILLRQSRNEKTALVCAKEKVSYRQLFVKCQDIKKHLQSMAHIGNNIGIFLPNSIDYVVAYFSIAFLNKVIVPIGIQAKEAELRSTIIYCELQVVLTDTKHGEMLRRFLEGFDHQVGLLNVENGCWEIINSDCCSVSKTENLGGASEDCVAIMLHTSGTTSKPKRVMLTHANLIHNVRSNIDSLKLNENDKTLIALPMFFGYCNTAQLLTHLYLGACIVILDSMFLPRYYFEAVAKHQITNFTGVPSMLLMLLTYRFRRQHESSLRLICFGGGRIPLEKLREMMKRFPTVGFVQTYGQTEASPRVTALLPEDSLRKIGSVGKPISGVRVRIADEFGNDMGTGCVGEIVVQGQNVMKGYYKRPEETHKVLRDGWLYTGDLAYSDAEGYIYLVGRKKNIIISGGLNIYPEEIEEILLGNPAVSEVRVDGEPHPFLCEIPVAHIVLQDNAHVVTSGQIIQYCLDRLAGYKVPARVEFVSELPKTVTNKIKRFQE